MLDTFPTLHHSISDGVFELHAPRSKYGGAQSTSCNACTLCVCKDSTIHCSEHLDQEISALH